MEIYPKEKVLKCGIKRKKNHLYFIDKDGDVGEVKMVRGVKNRKTDSKKIPPIKVFKAGIKKENGYLYFLDSDGDIGRVRGLKGGNTTEQRKILKIRKQKILKEANLRNKNQQQ